MANESKKTTPPPATVAPATPDNPVVMPEKRPRAKPVKYDKIIASEYDAAKFAATGNPLDAPISTKYGRLEFPGLEFIDTPLGSYVNIPTQGKRITAPTLRQIVRLIDEYYSAK